MEEINIPDKIDCENYTIELKRSSMDDLNSFEVIVHLKKELEFTNEFLRTIKSFDVETFIGDWAKNEMRKE